MATTRIIPMHNNKGKTISQSLKARIDYVKNPEKTNGGELITAYACSQRGGERQDRRARDPQGRGGLQGQLREHAARRNARLLLEDAPPGALVGVDGQAVFAADIHYLIKSGKPRGYYKCGRIMSREPLKLILAFICRYG